MEEDEARALAHAIGAEDRTAALQPLPASEGWIVRISSGVDEATFRSAHEYAAWRAERMPKPEKHQGNPALSFIGAVLGFLLNTVTQATQIYYMMRGGEREAGMRMSEPRRESETKGYGERLTHRRYLDEE